MKRLISIVGGVAATLVVVLSPGSAHAVEASTILAEVRDREDGDDVFADLRLVLRDANGGTRERQLVYLERDDGAEQRLTLYFTNPPDVRGVGLQSVNYEETADREDDQWMYLPAFRQTRRISTTDKRGAFMGSEFSYYDLDRLRVGDFTQQLVGEGELLGRPCWIMERVPASEATIAKTGYHRVKVWVDKEAHVVTRQQFFDSRGLLFKEMEVKALSRPQGIWTVDQADMINHLEGTRSSLIFSNVKYNVGLNQALFKRSVLESGVDGYISQVR